MDEQLDAILIQVTIPLPLAMIHAAFTNPETVAKWMCDAARIEPKVGGAYELSWGGESPFTSAGTVLRITPELDIGFSWFAPPDYAELMNRPTPNTQVYVRLQESPEGIDVTLEHSGWGSGPAWEEARSWHFMLWDDRLHRLKEFLLREAYG
ncbi:MAG: SRPBCC family protein [Thermoplasmata archaeon]